MRHIQRAAYGMFVAGILVSGVSAARAQAGPASPSGFKNRFYFQPDAPGRSTPDSEQLRNRLKELLISPAEAQTAPQHVAPTPEEASRTRGQTSKNSLLGKYVSERPIVVGRAAFYEHSGRTATGERYNPDGLTAAHK